MAATLVLGARTGLLLVAPLGQLLVSGQMPDRETSMTVVLPSIVQRMLPCASPWAPRARRAESCFAGEVLAKSERWGWKWVARPTCPIAL